MATNKFSPFGPRQVNPAWSGYNPFAKRPVLNPAYTNPITGQQSAPIYSEILKDLYKKPEEIIAPDEKATYIKPKETGDSGDGLSPLTGGASYSSPAEAVEWGKAGYKHGYYGTIQDAVEQAKQGNPKAKAALQSFIQGVNKNPVSLGPKAPGLLGLIADKTGLTDNKHGGVTQNVQDAIFGLEATGDLYSFDNSSGYQGDSIEEQQNLSDQHAATVYGDWSGWDEDHTVSSTAAEDAAAAEALAQAQAKAQADAQAAAQAQAQAQAAQQAEAARQAQLAAEAAAINKATQQQSWYYQDQNNDSDHSDPGGLDSSSDSFDDYGGGWTNRGGYIVPGGHVNPEGEYIMSPSYRQNGGEMMNNNLIAPAKKSFADRVKDAQQTIKGGGVSLIAMEETMVEPMPAPVMPAPMYDGQGDGPIMGDATISPIEVGPDIGADTVDAKLTPGEFVMNAEATEMYKPEIEAMNQQGLIARANGGPVYKNMGGQIDRIKMLMDNPSVSNSNKQMLGAIYREMGGPVYKNRGGYNPGANTMRYSPSSEAMDLNALRRAIELSDNPGPLIDQLMNSLTPIYKQEGGLIADAKANSDYVGDVGKFIYKSSMLDKNAIDAFDTKKTDQGVLTTKLNEIDNLVASGAITPAEAATAKSKLTGGKIRNKEDDAKLFTKVSRIGQEAISYIDEATPALNVAQAVATGKLATTAIIAASAKGADVNTINLVKNQFVIPALKNAVRKGEITESSMEAYNLMVSSITALTTVALKAQGPGPKTDFDFQVAAKETANLEGGSPTTIRSQLQRLVNNANTELSNLGVKAPVFEGTPSKETTAVVSQVNNVVTTPSVSDAGIESDYETISPDVETPKKQSWADRFKSITSN